MLKYDELLKTPEYWLEIIQNELFRQVKTYMVTENLNQTELAEKLGVTKGYISQILSGNCNFTLKKLTELALSLGLVPQISYKKADEFIREKTVSIKNRPYIFKPDNYKIEIRKNEGKIIKLAHCKDEFVNGQYKGGF